MGFVFHVSDTRIVVDGLPPDAERGMRAVWGLAAPLLAPLYEVRFEIRPDRGRFTLRTDGEVRATAVPPEDVLSTVEGVLYRDIEAWTPARRAMLHAASVHLGGRTFVLVGASGAGKSSLAHALLARGGRYLTDELTLFDGARLWGVPRAPQLDPTPVGDGLPEGFPAADLESYVFHSVDGPRALPILPLHASQVATAPYPADTAQLVFPRRAATTAIAPVPPAEALQRLHAEVRGRLARDLGPLLRRAPLALAWRTPVEAVEALLSWLAGTARGYQRGESRWPLERTRMSMTARS